MGEGGGGGDEAEAILLVSSRNYSSWSLRGWLLARMSGLPFTLRQVDPSDPDARAELLMRSSSVRVPCLVHGAVRLWDVLAIAEHLNETRPEARMMPDEAASRARCRSISGEMHSGFEALRTALPMNLRLHRPNFPTWSAVRADVARIEEIWRGCLGDRGGPWLFGERRSVADAMYAPVATRFLSYDVKLDPVCDAYCRATMEQADMVEWVQAALDEAEEFSELEMEF